jgi:DNA mismatch repair protein MutL
MCRNVFIEKALAFPHITFRLYDEKSLRIDLPKATLHQRVLASLASDKRVTPSDMIELSEQGQRFSLRAITSSGSSVRTDRSRINIYVNKRPIEEYAFIQAVTYGYGSILPGGLFPYCYLFIEVDSELADFNIHPAKREVKLRNMAQIHQLIIAMLRTGLPSKVASVPLSPAKEQNEFTFAKSPPSYRPSSSSETTPIVSEKPTDELWFAKAKEILQNKAQPTAKPQKQELPDFTYHGQLFSLFLLVEKGNSLFIIDQHAAHERILYDQLKEEKGIQRLMVPLEFEVERSIDDFLLANSPQYANYGLELSRSGDLLWSLSTIPALFKPIEQQVIAFISSFASTDTAELEKRLYATIACHSAIKDGDIIDQHTAIALIEHVFTLEHPVCPHGRMFVVEITKEQLFSSVDRTLS